MSVHHGHNVSVLYHNFIHFMLCLLSILLPDYYLLHSSYILYYYCLSIHLVDLLPHSLLTSIPNFHLYMLLLLYYTSVLLYRFMLLTPLHLLYYSRYLWSLLHNYPFLLYYYLVYTLLHYYLYYNFTYFHSSSHSLLMLNFHNFTPSHYSMSSNFMYALSFIHYYLMWNYLLLVLHHLLSMSHSYSSHFIYYPLHMLSYFHFMAAFTLY